jgi:outer membrane protein TolC
MKICRPGLLIELLLINPCFAQQASVIPPDPIVSQTLDHSYQLKVSDQEVIAFTAKRMRAKAQAMPTLDVKAQAARYQGLEDSSIGPELTIPAIENRFSASIGVTQPLFTGGRLYNQKSDALYRQSAAEQNLRATKSDLVFSARAAYWNWSKAYHAVQSIEAAVKRTEAHAVDMRNQHKAGMATDNELLATEVQLDQTRLFLEEAKNRVALTRARIELLTGNRLGENEVPEKAVAPPDWSASTTNTEADAIANRPEKAARTLDVKASEARVRSSKSDFYPQISLAARYEQANPNMLDFPPADEWKYDAFAGVTLSWNLLDWGLTRARVAEASARAEQARLRLSQVEEQMIFEVQEARINLQDAVSSVAVAERAEKSAQRNVEAATDLWRNGLARHSDVLDALARLTDAQYQLNAAQADVLLARAALDHATGQPGSINANQDAEAR